MSRARELRAFAVVDLGFGDAGKGLVTDWLTRRTGAGVIVRFNGGAQAGHNVVMADGRHHTFAQIGAGSLVPGVRTFLSRHVVVHPTALVREAEVLEAQGVCDPLSRVAISENALLVTPFHQAANRLRELARGPERHGSCGVGVGETVQAATLHPEEAIRAGDLCHPQRLVRQLERVRERLLAEAGTLSLPETDDAEQELAILRSSSVAETWRARCEPLVGCVAPDTTLHAWMSQSDAVVFEGAQGLLLDETLGFHPHTTWSRCTADNARELLAEATPSTPLRVCGVLRAHAVRHGPGPLPTEDASLQDLVAEHNAANAWQGPVRRGWFDAVLARYALALTGDLYALAITHLDAIARRTEWSMCDAYDPSERAPQDLVARARDGRIVDLTAVTRPCLERQDRLGQLLARCQPRLETIPAREADHVAWIEAHLGRKVDLLARGPTAGDVEQNITEPKFVPFRPL